jgi:fimbrial chaperone protein
MIASGRQSVVGVFGVVWLAALLASSPVAAFNFTPIDATLRPSGSAATQTFSLENPGTGPVAVELTVHVREMSETGDDRLSPADDVFTVYPSQLILQPGARQSVRLQWTGPTELDREQAFRLIAEELPIDLGDEEGDEEGAGLDLLVRYVASVYVQPANASARLSLELERGEKGIVLVARNQGTMRAVLRDEDFVIIADDQPVEWSEQQLEALSVTNVLAGHTRRLPIPGTAMLADRDLEVRWLRTSD